MMEFAVFGLLFSVIAVLCLLDSDRRLADASGTQSALFTALDQSHLADGPSGLMNRAESIRTPIRRTLRTHFFRSGKKPRHTAQRVGALYWVERNWVLRSPWAWKGREDDERIDDLIAALRHVLQAAPASEVADGEDAIDLALEDLTQLISGGHPAGRTLKRLYEATTGLLTEHRRQTPPVVVNLNVLLDGLGGFFQWLEREERTVLVQSNAILVRGGLARQVAYLIEHSISHTKQGEAFGLFLRVWRGEVRPLDRKYLENRRSNNAIETKYDADLWYKFQRWLAARPSLV